MGNQYQDEYDDDVNQFDGLWKTEKWKRSMDKQWKAHWRSYYEERCWNDDKENKWSSTSRSKEDNWWKPSSSSSSKWSKDSDSSSDSLDKSEWWTPEKDDKSKSDSSDKWWKQTDSS